MNNKMRLRDENGKIYFGWYIIIMASLIGTLIYNGIISTSGYFMVPVTTELQIPVGAFSLYISILSVANIITLYIVSKIVNKNNIKKIMLITGTLGVLSFVGFAFSSQVWHFYALSILQGICFAACTATPCTILVSNWFGPAVRGRAMSIYIGGMSLLGMVVVNILNMVIYNAGWRGGYIFCAVGILICLPLMAKFAVWSPAEKGIARMGEGEEMPPAGAVNPNAVPGYTVKEGLKKAPVWLVLISCVFLVLASSSQLTHQMPTMLMAGYTPTVATFISSLISVAMIGTNLIIGWSIDKFGIRFGATATCLLFALSTLCLALLLDMPSLLYPSVILYAFGVPAVNTVSPLVMAYVCGEKELHKFISYLNMLIAVGGIFGATLVGMMFDATGGYKTPWLVMTVALVVATVLRFIATSKKNRCAAIEVQQES